jgi:hypothetical protein
VTSEVALCGASSEYLEEDSGSFESEGVDSERGSLEVTSEVAERSASSEYLNENSGSSELSLDREYGSQELTSEAAERGASSEYLEGDRFPVLVKSVAVWLPEGWSPRRRS